MKIHDAGTSIGKISASPHGWETLELSSLWRNVVEILCPASFPRQIQIEALRSARLLESRRNLLVSAPTNSGKTLIGLLALLDAVRRGRRAVLLEPIRALAREKAEWLQSLAKPLGKAIGQPFSVRITTGDYRIEQEAFASPPPDQGELIIATPERYEAILRNPDYGAWAESVDAVCVDEAHLLSSPRRGLTLEFLLTSLLCRSMPPRLILLSATLGETTRLVEWLAPCDVIHTTDRYPALCKQVWELEANEKAEEVVQRRIGEILAEEATSILVFVYQTRSAERLADSFADRQVRAYHAQMNLAQREKTRQAFVTGECRCLITTTALGLGVNLPATHVIVRDLTFPGIGRLEVSELLQMMGRAGRGNKQGESVVIVRPTDTWGADQLAQALCTENIGELSSPMERLLREPREGERQQTLASCVAAFLARRSEIGSTLEDCRTFFLRSFGGQAMASHLPVTLRWLTDPRRALTYQDESGRYRMTRLGLNSIRSTLPLSLAAGFAQLIRDLLSVDSEDRLLQDWMPLDTLIVLTLFAEQSPHLRPYSVGLEEQINAWMENRPEHTSLLYREWIRGIGETSRAEEIMGSLGIVVEKRSRNVSSAKASAIAATFHALLMWDRGQGKERSDIERQWSVRNLDGIEERWRDELLWLLSGLAQTLDLKCFYYHLNEGCKADKTRIRRVKQALRRIHTQTYELRECLTYCSTLGTFLRSLRHTQTGTQPKIGIQTIRILESAGIHSPAEIAQMDTSELIKCGVRPKSARQILNYLRRRLQ